MRTPLISALLILFVSCFISAAPTKIAILGDSITFGAGAKARENNRYASRLGHLLSKDSEVKTFAESSLCMLNKADLPYIKTKHFKDAIAFQPDIVFITLGTNDTCQNAKRKNWQHHTDLYDDAIKLIEALRDANPKVVVHLCSPPPMFPNQPGLTPDRKTDLTERAKRLPVIKQAYTKAAAKAKWIHYHDLSRAIDTNTTTDGVHPDTFGHEQLAHHLYDLLALPTGVRADLSTITSKKTQWHGFDQHTFTLPKTKASAKLIIPHTAAQGQPWIWRARFFGHQPELDLALLDRGYHLAYVDVANLFGSQQAMDHCAELHQFLTKTFNLHQKPILEGMSRGGLMIFNYAARYPKNVTAIYGDNPVCNFNSWPGGKNGKFSKSAWKRCLKIYGITAEQAPTHAQITDPAFAAKLAQSKIPVALVLGTADDVVPISENGALFALNYAKAKGPLKVWLKPGLGHHPHGLHPAKPLLRFLLKTNTPNRKHIANTPSPSSEHRGGAGWGGTWWQAFDHLKAQVKKNPNTQIIFLGDSITQGLTGHSNRASQPGGKRAIDNYYGQQKALSLGLSGDRTEHILWRLQHGQLNGIKPTHLVLMIGVNNINAGHTGEETADGTKAIVEWFKANRPKIKVLLLGCFPAGKDSKLPIRAEINSLHQLIKPLADNQTIFYQDIRSLFLKDDGSMNDRMSGDAIHINGKGQDAWMNTVKPFFNK